jgi:hypothetical protein
MKHSSDRALRLVQNGLLRVASLLVPAGQRSEWRREWQTELWYVRRSCCAAGARGWKAQHRITCFCLGSLQDAFCLRREFHQDCAPAPRVDSAAGQCILRLGTLLGVVVILANLLPGVQTERDPTRFQVNPGLILIQHSPSSEIFAPSIPTDLFRNWKGTRQRNFDGFAFYRIAHETATLPSHRTRPWSVSHASLNLFSLLGFELPFDTATNSNLPAAVISHEAWRREFGADPGIAGRIIRIGHRFAKVAGVMPYGVWRLPGNPDAWLLEPDTQLADATAPGARGYLIAHLTPQGKAAMHGVWVPITVRGSDDLDTEFYGVSFASRLRGPSGVFQFALILALLALPAVTSLSLGESNYSSHRPSRERTLIRWAFLAAKFLLVAAIGYFASLDLAYWNTATYSPLAECAQLAWSFFICLVGFRWALADQRQRCPVCLSRVTHPASVGLASRTFLGWNGTEMMCMGGHTLLHVPTLPTSWFSGQRWLYLDTSWEFLFADPVTW